MSLIGSSVIPGLVRQQFSSRLYVTAFFSWPLILFSKLADERKERTLGTDLYVMF